MPSRRRGRAEKDQRPAAEANGAVCSGPTNLPVVHVRCSNRLLAEGRERGKRRRDGEGIGRGHGGGQSLMNKDENRRVHAGAKWTGQQRMGNRRRFRARADRQGRSRTPIIARIAPSASPSLSLRTSYRFPLRPLLPLLDGVSPFPSVSPVQSGWPIPPSACGEDQPTRKTSDIDEQSSQSQ